jgi:hypothetical protein
VTTLLGVLLLAVSPVDGSVLDGSESAPPPPACEDFAQRQIKLAERLQRQSNYTRALKVLNSTANNCDIEAVREKIVEVLGEWYSVVRGQGSGAIRQFMGVLDNQSHVSSAQKERFKRRIEGQVQALIEREYRAEEYEATYRLCRSYPAFASEDFESEYYCGSAAEEVGADGVAMNSYQWLVQNWNENQSLASWTETASRLENLYFLNGRFREAYELARQRARRDPSPQVVLSSLVSARGHFLSPVLRAGAAFYENQPPQAALSLVETELQRVNFPKYVKAIYLLGSDGSLEKGMYGTEANEPSTSLLDTASGAVSLLQSKGESNLAWLVSPVGDRFLVLEFGIATTPEENVRLETVLENIQSDEQWQKLYNLESTETSPAAGSAVGTILSGVSVGDQDLAPYRNIFDDSPLLTYYCIQDNTGTVIESYNFDRANLGYGDNLWQETSNTPALYHHLIQYSGEPVREVVWPKFVDENWTGVVRVGLTRG